MRRFAILVLVVAGFLSAPSSPVMGEWRLPLVEELPKVGCVFPDFPIPDTTGKMVWFNDFRGTPLLVSFCSCYTDTCCPLINTMEEIRNLFGESFITIFVCCEIAAAMETKGYEKLLFECREAADVVLIDPLGETMLPFRVEVLPTSYLIDGDFCVRYRAMDVRDLNTTAFREALKKTIEDFPGRR